jgi:hypothetical protein
LDTPQPDLQRELDTNDEEDRQLICGDLTYEEGQVCVEAACVEQICDPDAPAECVDSGTLLICVPPGIAQINMPCEEGEICLDGSCDERGCTPGETMCDDRDVVTCDETGSAWEFTETCGPDDRGTTCVDGQCRDLCAAMRRTRAYLGCEYTAVDLPNSYNDLEFAISIANPQDELTATVIIKTMAGTLANLEVAPRSVGSFIDTERLFRMHGTEVVANAYRVTSSVPVALYQFNSLETEGAASTDASLLFPDHALGDQYLALTYSGDGRSAATEPFVAVYAPVEGTEVWIQNGPNATIAASTTRSTFPIPEVAPGGYIPFDPDDPPDVASPLVLGPYDVLLLRADSALDDLTGTSISASNPIGVFSGNNAAQVPRGRQYQDHLEQQLFPRQALGKHYLIGRSRRRPVIGRDDVPCNEERACGRPGQVCCEQLGDLCISEDRCFECTTDAECSAGEMCCSERGNTCLRPTQCSEEYAIPDYIRILADEPDTTVSFTPPLFDDVLLAEAGDWVEIELNSHVEINATEPVIVGQFFAGSNGWLDGNCEGDPTFILQVPVEQYRSDYVFLCPATYDSDYVSITAAPETAILLDGSPITLDDRVVGSGGMSVTIIEVEDGDHTIEGDAPFGIIVYGFGGPCSMEATVINVSYGYPGGLNLLTINPKD